MYLRTQMILTEKKNNQAYKDRQKKKVQPGARPRTCCIMRSRVAGSRFMAICCMRFSSSGLILFMASMAAWGGEGGMIEEGEERGRVGEGRGGERGGRRLLEGRCVCQGGCHVFP
jgi:hypothetical protein